MKNPLFAFQSDAKSSYELYKKYSDLEKRDMFFYWKGILTMYVIDFHLSLKQKAKLEDYLIDLYYKDVRFLNKVRKVLK